MLRVALSLFAAAAVAVVCLAQSGDKKGEVQKPRVPAEKIPPAPPLSPADALKAIRMAPGFKLQTAAHEPAVQVPIALQFDPNGRMWVLEMRGFMPNPDGAGEEKPVGRVSILEDTDGDGVYEKAKVFLEGLVMPRAFLLTRGGLLLAEPPKLWFYPISKDDQPGERVLVDDEYAKEADTKLGPKANPEHAANSLTLAMDNWIYSMDHTRRYRFIDGQWVKQSNPKRSQYGMAQDNYGRLFYNSNSDQLRADLVPSAYVRAGVTGKLNGVAMQIAKDQNVWPIRVNPGVNRGYQTGTLREDGTLWKFTAACGTTIYRGDALPPDCVGNAFLCEPSGNIVRRNILFEKDGIVTASNAYERAEFMASTDELFRPVNTYTGPDGALYVVDMYHGIVQHRFFLTTYLRQQAESRGLDKVVALGRIYRVRHESKQPSARLQLGTATTADLVKALGHANGWVRDTAQRLLVEKKDLAALAGLRETALKHENHLARLHALWTLEGFERIDTETTLQALNDQHPKVRAAAVRVSESLMQSPAGNPPLRAKLLSLTNDAAADVQIQLALTLGAVPADDGSRAALATLRQSPFTLAKDAASYSFNVLAAKSKPAVAQAKPQGPKLSPGELKRFEAGKMNYEMVCMPCHQAHGNGQEGLAPPLVGSEWVGWSDARLVRLVLHGVRGPITVKGQPFELDMPGLGVLEDEQIATILTYIRNEWGHSYPPVSTDSVKKIRAETAERVDAWTQEELLKLP
jgi:mono/diheme cytochrome c family protein/glucose/arabinose dehydrogenase